jgi:hypothetical protein
LFTLSGRRVFFSAAVVLPLQPDEMIREALDSLTGLGGELVCCGIVNRSCCSHDLVSAAQEGTSLAEERLCLLGCLRRRGSRAPVGGRAVCHGDSFLFPAAGDSAASCPDLLQVGHGAGGQAPP